MQDNPPPKFETSLQNAHVSKEVAAKNIGLKAVEETIKEPPLSPGQLESDLEQNKLRANALALALPNVSPQEDYSSLIKAA